MAEEGLYFIFAYILWVGFATIKFNIAQNPIGISFFCPIRVVVITHDLPDLFHEFEPGIRAKFLFVFQITIEYGNNMKKQGIFPLFAHNIAIGGKYFDAIRPICGKFSL